jgi:hypothetical protein
MFEVANVNAEGFRAEGGANTSFTNNVFLDQSKEWDLVLHTPAEVGLDFANIYSAGYSVELNAYGRHTALLSHLHQLYLLANPAWGAEEEHELTVEFSVETLRNQSEYLSNNLLRPILFARLEMEPKRWLRFSLSSKLLYAWYYDDQPSSSFDFWGYADVSFTLPSRTTLSPRISYGYRYYPKQDLAVTLDTRDQQFELGIHSSQALWETTGLQADYIYIWALGNSGLLLRKITQDQFSYLDQGFLYSGSQAMIGIKQLLGESFTLEFTVRFKEHRFAGWKVLDASGAPTNDDRRDLQLSPALGLSYVWPAEGDEEDAAAFHLRVGLEYSFTKQWSNSDWYDASAHSFGFTIHGSF